jgi:hypothetical protein
MCFLFSVITHFTPAIMALYTVTGVRRHGWQPTSSNIGLLSYVAVQTVDCFYRTRFRFVHSPSMALDTIIFALIPSYAAMRTLNGTNSILPVPSRYDHGFDLNACDLVRSRKRSAANPLARIVWCSTHNHWCIFLVVGSSTI